MVAPIAKLKRTCDPWPAVPLYTADDLYWHHPRGFMCDQCKNVFRTLTDFEKHTVKK